MAEWITVGAAAEVPPGHAARVVIGATELAIFNVDGKFHCINDLCSHAEASLSEGDLDVRRCVIECPLHGSAFDLRTGEAVTLPAVEPVQVHDIDVNDGQLRISLRGER